MNRWIEKWETSNEIKIWYESTIWPHVTRSVFEWRLEKHQVIMIEVDLFVEFINGFSNEKFFVLTFSNWKLCCSVLRPGINPDVQRLCGELRYMLVSKTSVPRVLSNGQEGWCDDCRWDWWGNRMSGSCRRDVSAVGCGRGRASTGDEPVGGFANDAEFDAIELSACVLNFRQQLGSERVDSCFLFHIWLQR